MQKRKPREVTDRPSGRMLSMLGVHCVPLAACDSGPCGIERMTRLIEKDLRDRGRSASEFTPKPPVQDGAQIYIGMAARQNPLFHHHYWIDPRACRLTDVLIDQ